MQTTSHDILIVGGGPAGTAAALTLLKYTNLDVAIIESTDYTDLRIGETISPSVLPLLRYLGCEEDFLRSRHIPSFSIDAAWGTTQLQSRDFLFTAQGNGWHLERVRFDKMLAKKVSRLCKNFFIDTKFVSQKRIKKKWQIIASSKNGQKRKINSDIIIDASGRNAVFARSLGSKWKIHDTLIGAACFYHNNGQKPIQQRMVIETTPYGWWYTSPIPRNNRVVVFITDSDIGKKLDIMKNWQSLLEKTIHIKREVAGRVTAGPKIFPAYSHIIQKISQKNWLPAGDAASSFDPVSSMGIGYSMLSGIHAARCANDLKNGYNTAQNYMENIARNFDEYLNRVDYYYNNEKRWITETFWKRRLGRSIKQNQKQQLDLMRHHSRAIVE